MELYDRIVELADANLIYCLPPMLLTLILFDIIFKGGLQIRKNYLFIRWAIIAYSIVTLIQFLIGLSFFADKFAFINRAAGPYKVAYWILFVSATFLPFSLLFKKLGENPFYLFFVAIMMKIGWYFESFVIITTSYHRDYTPSNENSDWLALPLNGIFMTWTQGFMLALILIGITKVIEQKKTVHKIKGLNEAWPRSDPRYKTKDIHGRSSI
jgi:hypothetical protein